MGLSSEMASLTAFCIVIASGRRAVRAGGAAPPVAEATAEAPVEGTAEGTAEGTEEGAAEVEVVGGAAAKVRGATEAVTAEEAAVAGR